MVSYKQVECVPDKKENLGVETIFITFVSYIFDSFGYQTTKVKMNHLVVRNRDHPYIISSLLGV